MTTFTSPLIVRPIDTSYPGGQLDNPGLATTVAAAFRAGAIAVVSGAGAGTVVAASNALTVFASAETSNVRCRGFIRVVVDGTTAVVPFFYTNV